MMSGNDAEVAVEAKIPEIEVGTSTTKGIGISCLEATG